jgi:hypothetical protein
MYYRSFLNITPYFYLFLREKKRFSCIIIMGNHPLKDYEIWPQKNLKNIIYFCIFSVFWKQFITVQKFTTKKKRQTPSHAPPKSVKMWLHSVFLNSSKWVVNFLMSWNLWRKLGSVGCKFFLILKKKCMHSCPFPCWKKWNFLGGCKILSRFWCVLGVGLWLGWTFAEIFGRPCTYVVAYKSCASHNFQVPKGFFLWKLYRMYFYL